MTLLKIPYEQFQTLITKDLGEIEARRIEKFISMQDKENFSFDTGLLAVDDLYKLDLIEIITQCLSKVFPQQSTLPVSVVRKGLMVNRDTHIQPKPRKITQDLLNAIKSLGDPKESVQKETF